MKPSLAAQFLSAVFSASVASSSSVSVAEELDKKNVDAAAASRESRNLESIVATSSKSSKSSTSCPPVPTPGVQCGNVYVNSTVILGENLICTEAADIRSTALTLTGKDAVLDCQGYTISQETNSSDAALECPSQFETKECGLFYEYGVILKDGASMRNCNIQKFLVGSFMVKEGEIKNSGFSLNRIGVEIDSFADNTVSKIANSEFYNNYSGLKALSFNENDSKVVIEDVIAKNNQDTGIYLTGTGITVNNANSRNNRNDGLLIGSFVENEITLAGDIFIANNVAGLEIEPLARGTVYVTGDINLNHNKLVGLAATNTDADSLTVAVGRSYSGKSVKSGSGSLTACDNNQFDIATIYGTVTFEGSDYISDNNKTFGKSLPDCKPCHPGCL